MDYYNRYELFKDNENIIIPPNLTIPTKGTDEFEVYKQGQTTISQISNKYYKSPFFSFLIFMANEHIPSNEPDIPDNSLLRIPYPLNESIKSYKEAVLEYNRIY